MINPGEIPQIPGDMDALARHAASLRSSGSSFRTTGASVHSTWQSLAEVYDAPEVGQLLTATAPVSQVSGTVGDNVEAVAAALSTYAEKVKPIKARLESLRGQAQSFVTSVEGDDDWREDEGKVDQHNRLLSQVNEAVAEWMAAQRSCANAINATYGGTQYVADNGDGHRAANEFGYTADQLNSAMSGEGGLPWGTPEEHDGGLLSDVGDFFGGIKDGAVQMVTDLGALIGYSNGEWSWSTAGAAWKGLGTFALALGAYATPFGAAADQAGLVPFMKRGQLGNTLLTAGKSIIAYDQWGKGHNGRAAGMATFNIVSAVVGTKGAGGALRGAGAAIKGAEAAGVAGRVGGAAIRAGDFLVKMPTVGELGIKLANKLDIHIPHIGPTPALAGPGHHVDVHVPETRGPEAAHMSAGNHSAGPSLGDATRHAQGHGPDGQPHSPAQHGNSPAQHADAPGRHADSPGQHADSPGQHSESPAQHADSPGQHAESPGHHPDGSHSTDEHGAPGHHDPDHTDAPEHPSDDHTPNDAGGEHHGPDQGSHEDHGHTGHDLEHGDGGAHLPDEPRGVQPDGSWRGEHGLHLSPEANAAADRFIERASTNEPRITDQMRAIERSIDHGRLEGLDFRLKGEDSLKRKLATDMAEDINLSHDEALAGIRDSVRYTLEVPSGNYSHGVEHAVHRLQAEGFENIKFKNTWGSDGYQGINSTWRDPATGQTFELQFHTPESFAAKMEAHELYEQQRLPGNTPEQIRELEARQHEIFHRVEQPVGSSDLHAQADAGTGQPAAEHAAPPAADADTERSPWHGHIPGESVPHLPPHVTPETWEHAGQLLQEKAREIGGQAGAQGSRVSGTHRPDSDIDFGIKVDDERFREILEERRQHVTPGSNKWETLRVAEERGRIHGGEAGLRPLRKQLERELGMEVDLSLIERGGLFDNGRWIMFGE